VLLFQDERTPLPLLSNQLILQDTNNFILHHHAEQMASEEGETEKGTAGHVAGHR